MLLSSIAILLASKQAKKQTDLQKLVKELYWSFSVYLLMAVGSKNWPAPVVSKLGEVQLEVCQQQCRPGLSSPEWLANQN